MGRRDSELKAIYDRIGRQFDLETYELGHRLFPENLRVLDSLVTTYSTAGLYRRSLDAARLLTVKRPGNSRYRYNLACSLCCLGELDDALEALERAVGLGFDDFEYLTEDPDLAALRSRPEFQVYQRRAKEQRAGRVAEK